MPDLERLAGTVIGQVRSRLELLAVEWQEEKIRLGRTLLSMVLVLFFVELTAVMVVIGLVVAFWDTPSRLMIVAFAAALCGGAAFLSFRHYRGGLADKHQLFEASIAELKRDEDALHRPGPEPVASPPPRGGP